MNKNLQDQVENLTNMLSERENELHEVREKLAESEWNETTEINRLKKEIEELKKKDNESAEIKRLKNEIEELKKKDNKENNNIQLKALQKVIDTKDKDLQNLQRVNDRLSSKQNEKVSNADISNSTNTTNVEDIVKNIQVAISNRFQVLQDSLTATIDEKIKISTVPTNATSFSDAVTSGTQNPPDFRKIMLTNRNEQLVEERDKASRAKNLIIHRIEETDDNQVKNYIKGLLETVGASAIEPKSFARIGKAKEVTPGQASVSSSRKPIVLNFKSESDKNKVFNNLSKLKGNEAYTRISITEDYTIPERKLVHDMKEQVKARNSLEPDDSSFIWKLRGTPKNGLQILRFKKAY